jgi:hypothetical protein
VSAPDCHIIWIVQKRDVPVRCQLLTCCSGAELQVVEGDEITLRELYPEKSDLYERARQLKADYEARVNAGDHP